jgi:hypothetical protein
VPDRRVPPVGANPRALFLSLSFAALSPSLSPCARDQPSSATAHQGPPPFRDPHRVCSLGKLRCITRSSGRPLNRPFLLWCAQSALTGALLVQPESRRRRPASSPCPSFRLCVPGTPLKVTVLAPTLFSPISHLPSRDCSSEYPPACPELPFAVWPPHPHSHKTDPP